MTLIKSPLPFLFFASCFLGTTLDWCSALQELPGTKTSSANLTSKDSDRQLTATKPQTMPDWLIDKSSFTSHTTKVGDHSLLFSNGIVTRSFTLKPALATINLTVISNQENLIRAVRPEAIVTINGTQYPVGGLVGQPNHAFLKKEWLQQMRPSPNGFRLASYKTGPITPRIEWKRIRAGNKNSVWPPKGKRLTFRFEHEKLDGIKIEIHYDLYDGLPCFCKWIEVRNESPDSIVLNKITTETLAIAEDVSWVETRDGVSIPHPHKLHVETDFAFGGFNHQNANRHVVHWRTDPLYSTQVNYLKKTPCLLEVTPTQGPEQTIQSKSSFKSYHTFELIHDSSDRERQNLALRKMYRTVAPWVTENPLMMHLKASRPDLVRKAIDQCHEVGFEMLILSFGSGFNIENRSAAYRQQWKEIAKYAQQKGIEIGGYSLLSSRRIGGGNDIVSPEGTKPTHGNCPALTSKWGQDYFANLYDFFESSGFSLLEHDGSYPGDIDTTERLPLQKGELDSRWVQWRIIADYYAWCRKQGIYLNVPDYYFLAGSNKCGMGYREVNWSLPREHQVLHTRQNIFDGTRFKTPSMGWMFVPLTQYHGGGAAATVEPLAEHLDHYERMLVSNLGAGVQACYRGPRLYDTEKTKQVVKKWVDWFKLHREILESDIIHNSSRRADGQDLDWYLHANPELKTKGMLLVFNPTDKPINKTIRLDLYYTGLRSAAKFEKETNVVAAAKQTITLPLDGRSRCQLEVTVPANGFTWYTIESQSN